MNTVTKKPELFRCTGTYDKKQADSIAQNLLVNGPPDSNKISKESSQMRNMVFCDYLYSFWEYDTCDYIKEKITEGKYPKKSDISQDQFIAVNLSEQSIPGTYEWTLNI